MQTWIRVILIGALLWGAVACGADEDSQQEPTNNDAVNNQNNGDTNNGDANNGDANNGTENNGTENNGEVVRPACEVIAPMEQAEAVYDAYLLPPLEEFVGELVYIEATVRRDGDDLTVVVGDDEIPAVFEAAPELAHCVANPDASVLKLCFYKANGEPAEPGALGAVFRPLGASLFAVAAHRRGVSRPCTPGGHYALTVDSVDEGGAPFAQEAVERLLGYLGYFEIEGQGAVMMGDTPRLVVVDADEAALTFSGELSDDLFVDAEGTEWDLEIVLSDGAFTLGEEGEASVSVTVTLHLSVPGGDSYAVVAQVSGERL